MAISIFSSREMTRPFVKEFKPKTELARRFIKRREVHQTRTFQIDQVTGGRIMAVFSSPLREGVPVRRDGFSTNDITPGYIKLLGAISPEDCQNRMPGEAIFAPAKAPLMDRATKIMMAGLVKMDDAIVRRVEYMAMEALTTGKVTIVDMDNEGNVVEVREVDFGYHADHTPTPTIDWDAEGATILDNLAAWAKLCARDGGMYPNVMYCDDAVGLALMNDATIQKFLDCRYANAAEMQIALDQANGVTEMGVLRAPNLTVRVKVYNEWYTDPATGTLTELFPADSIMLGNTNADVALHYRPIEDFDISEEFPEAAGGNALAIPRFVKAWKKKNPSVYQYLMQSGPIVVPNDINCFLTAKVLNNTEASV